MKYKKILIILMFILFFVSQLYTNNLVFAQDINQVATYNKDKKTSLFMWGVDNIDYTAFDDLIDYLYINTLYIGRSDTNEIRDFSFYDYQLLFTFAQRKKLDSYIIYDEKYIQQDQNFAKIKELIDQVYEYNQNAEYKLLGIAIDSEFHTTEEYNNATEEERVDMFKSYVDCMKNAYRYAKTKQLRFVACIPTWYDLIDEQQLEELVKNGCDYIQLMNYEKENMIPSISKEVELAKKYNKPMRV